VDELESRNAGRSERVKARLLQPLLWPRTLPLVRASKAANPATINAYTSEPRR